MRTSSFATLLLASLGLWACNLSVKDDLKDADDTLEESIPDVDVDADLNIKVCGDQTLGDLLKADGLSDDCRDKVESFLPSPQSSFDSRLVVLGQTHEADGTRTLFVIGGDAEGNALFSTPPSEVSASVKVEGKVEVIASTDILVELPLAGDLLALSVVNDYSASMREADLADVSEIETDLFTYLPPLYESEVVQFSTGVNVKQAFSADKAALLSAVDIDDTYARESTALYDGMGTALDSLVKRERPLRVLLVSTDGKENASMTYTKDQLLQTRDANGVIVIMLGALFADVSELKTLAGDRGVFVYARGYGRLKTAVAGLIDSLSHIAAVHLPRQADQADEATLQLLGQTVTVPLAD